MASGAIGCLLGGLLVTLLNHWTASRRDYVKERRAIRARYLIEAYEQLYDASGRGAPERSTRFDEAVEQGIRDITLLGDPEEVRATSVFL